MRHLILSESMGVYLGSCMGMGFWSKLDPVGQPSAVTFESVHEAQQVIGTWDGLDTLPADLTYPAVRNDEGDYASIAACIEAGASEWSTAI